MPAPVTRVAFVYRLRTPAKGASWIQVAATGHFVSPVYGEFDITPTMLATMLANFQTKHPRPPTELVVDYDHLTLNPQHAGDGRAAGWIKDLELREDGAELWASVDWTDTGRSSVESGEYRYVSPVFARSYTSPGGEALGPTLLGCAITNTPFLQGMAPCRIAANAALAGLVDLALAELSYSEKMQRLQRALGEQYGSDIVNAYLQDVFADALVYRSREKLFRAPYTFAEDGTPTIGLPGEEVAVNYVTLTESRMANEPKTPPVDPPAPPPPPTPPAPEENPLQLRAEVTTLRTQVDTLAAANVELNTRLTAVTTALTDRDAEDAVMGLIHARKLVPAQKDSFKALFLSARGQFDAITSTLPVVGPVIHTQHGSGGAPPTDQTPTDQLFAFAATLREKDPKLSEPEALKLAARQHPDIFAAHVAASTIKV